MVVSPHTIQVPVAAKRATLHVGFRSLGKLVLLALWPLFPECSPADSFVYEIRIHGRARGTLTIDERLGDDGVVTTERCFALPGIDGASGAPPYRCLSKETREGKPIYLEIQKTAIGDEITTVQLGLDRGTGASFPQDSSRECGVRLWYGVKLIFRDLAARGSGEITFPVYSVERGETVRAGVWFEARENDRGAWLRYWEEREDSALRLLVDPNGDLVRLESESLDFELIRLAMDTSALPDPLDISEATGIAVTLTPGALTGLRPGERAYRVVGLPDELLTRDSHQRLTQDSEGRVWAVASAGEQNSQGESDEAEKLEPYLRMSDLVSPIRADLPDARNPMECCELVRSRLRQRRSNGGLLPADKAWELQTGDCTEYSVVLASLARRAELPARLVFGLSVPAPGHGEAVWHVCTEIHWRGQWRLFDSTTPSGFPTAAYVRLFTLSTDREDNPFAQIRKHMLAIRLVETCP